MHNFERHLNVRISNMQRVTFRFIHGLPCIAPQWGSGNQCRTHVGGGVEKWMRNASLYLRLLQLPLSKALTPHLLQSSCTGCWSLWVQFKPWLYECEAGHNLFLLRGYDTGFSGQTTYISKKSKKTVLLYTPWNKDFFSVNLTFFQFCVVGCSISLWGNVFDAVGGNFALWKFNHLSCN